MVWRGICAPAVLLQPPILCKSAKLVWPAGCPRRSRAATSGGCMDAERVARYGVRHASMCHVCGQAREPGVYIRTVLEGESIFSTSN